jgi:hypothetical protein
MVGKATSSRRRATVSASWVLKGASDVGRREIRARVRAPPPVVKALCRDGKTLARRAEKAWLLQK